MDGTEHAFDVKTNKKYRQIRDEDLEHAAGFAIIEAGNWYGAANVLLPYKKNIDCQICVMTLFAIELYLKAILMKKGINITTRKQSGHDIYSMYKSLSSDEQDIIKDGVEPSGKDYYDVFGEHINLDSFDKELKFISNDFVQLRYHYEKFMNGEPIFAYPEFILAVCSNCKKLARSIVYPADN